MNELTLFACITLEILFVFVRQVKLYVQLLTRGRVCALLCLFVNRRRAYCIISQFSVSQFSLLFTILSFTILSFSAGLIVGHAGSRWPQKKKKNTLQRQSLAHLGTGDEAW